MLKNFLLWACIAMIGVSCNTYNPGKSINILQFDNTEAQYLPDTIYCGSKIDKTFFMKLADAAGNGKVQAFEFPLFTFDFSGTLEKINPEKLKTDLAPKDIVISSEDTATGKISSFTISRDFRKDAGSIHFIEDWMLDSDLKFSKKIRFYAPVQYYFTAGSLDKKVPNLAFAVANKDISGKNEKELVPVAKHIFYTVSLTSGESGGPLIMGLNKQRLLSLLVDSMIARKTKVFDVDLANFEVAAELSPEKVRRNLGERIDSIFATDASGTPVTIVDTLKATECKNQVNALFFIEDWFYDAETFSLKKKIIAFGPVREYENPDIPGKIHKSIPYAIVLKQD